MRGFAKRVAQDHSNVSAAYFEACVTLIGCGCVSTSAIIESKARYEQDSTLPMIHWLIDKALIPTIAMHAGRFVRMIVNSVSKLARSSLRSE